MANRAMNIFECQCLIDAILYRTKMNCESQLSWVPYYDRWHLLIEAKYKYLKFKKIFYLDRDYYLYHESMMEIIEEFGDILFKEFDSYFNAIWC